MGRFIRMLAGLLVLAALLAAGWIWLTLRFAYSTGERAGYVQKFSRKGWLFKTWEGELAMVNVPGALQDRFPFTVRRADVADQLRGTMGQRVVIEYEQHKFVPTQAFGETEYFVVGVRPVPEAAFPPEKTGPPAPAVRP